MAIKFILSGVISFLFACLFAPLVISVCKKLKASQTILHYVDKHAGKQGTPTMGGVIFLAAMLVGLCFLLPEQRFTSIFLILVTLSYGLLGFLDDFIKIRYRHNEGLRPYQKNYRAIWTCLNCQFVYLFFWQDKLKFFWNNIWHRGFYYSTCYSCADCYH